MNYAPEEGSRVELAPHTDAWMSGNRYGTVTSVQLNTRLGETTIAVKLDKGRHLSVLLRPADIAKEIQP